MIQRLQDVRVSAVFDNFGETSLCVVPQSMIMMSFSSPGHLDLKSMSTRSIGEVRGNRSAHVRQKKA
jgi:hypothetical protein